MSDLQYRIVETPTGATASIFVPGRQPMIVQSSHPLFEEIVTAAREGDAGLVAWLVNGGSGPSPHSVDEAWLASRGKLGARPVATCPACSMPVSVAPGDVDNAVLTCPFCATEWNEFVVPDRIGAIVSWKGLTWRPGGLVSPVSSDFVWKPGIAATASCRNGRKHLAPDPNCTCGIYSGKTRAHQVRLNYVNSMNGVLAELHLSGQVVVATNGFRAQYARIARLIVPTGVADGPTILHDLGPKWEAVGVEVTEEPLFSAEYRAKWCPACGHPAPDDTTAINCPACDAFLERG